MKHSLIALMLLASACGQSWAQSEVFLCIDENGKREYKNTGATKGCKKVDLPGITMIPAPPSVARKPVVQNASAKPSNPAPDFPKVDGETQKTRDNDRRQILLDEMKSEEQKLANLRKEYNNGEPERRGDERNYAKYQERVAAMKDDITRAEKNVEALRREIANLK
ncbi:DUF4124 domain-containing protein [Noviherbaspirillum aridicola]|uniref:DUF4124 domain-containing protein n=1 Tax=Noviherbaspirillum aridicola TaxID=2849687 RepID=A0ABQ4Q0U8_9BURK|nr:DUF4124 domain-containing protein [Noviherbaspirillum aridicola]GIZ50676.1 hypothetical protein NCCP691_06900 [Noviherbaspirillum aridicola]